MQNRCARADGPDHYHTQGGHVPTGNGPFYPTFFPVMADVRIEASRAVPAAPAVLAYLSRFSHPVVIANSRPFAFDGERVTFS